MVKTEPCIICMKPVRIDKPHYVLHRTTSNEIVSKIYSGADSQGVFAIGRECRKRFKYAFKVEGRR